MTNSHHIQEQRVSNRACQNLSDLDLPIQLLARFARFAPIIIRSHFQRTTGRLRATRIGFLHACGVDRSIRILR